MTSTLDLSAYYSPTIQQASNLESLIFGTGQLLESTTTDTSQTKADIADIKNDIETLRQSVRDLVVAS